MILGYSSRYIPPFSQDTRTDEIYYIYSMQISYVYILECSDRTYYTGITSILDKRLIEHQKGIHKESYTYSRRPVEFTDINLAITTEKQIKKWSRAKKEALINDEFDKLPNLAKKKF